MVLSGGFLYALRSGGALRCVVCNLGADLIYQSLIGPVDPLQIVAHKVPEPLALGVQRAALMVGDTEIGHRRAVGVGPADHVAVLAQQPQFPVFH